MFVHLHSGDVVPVTGVTDLEVTDTRLILQREARMPVTFPRSDVYYACCESDMAPPQF